MLRVEAIIVSSLIKFDVCIDANTLTWSGLVGVEDGVGFLIVNY